MTTVDNRSVAMILLEVMEDEVEEENEIVKTWAEHVKNGEIDPIYIRFQLDNPTRYREAGQCIRDINRLRLARGEETIVSFCKDVISQYEYGNDALSRPIETDYMNHIYRFKVTSIDRPWDGCQYTVIHLNVIDCTSL